MKILQKIKFWRIFVLVDNAKLAGRIPTGLGIPTLHGAIGGKPITKENVVPEETTNNPKGVARKPHVAFRRCTSCKVERPHGFIFQNEAKVPVQLFSVAGGKYLLEQVGEPGVFLDEAGLERVLGEMREAVLPDSLLDGEESSIDAQLDVLLLADMLR